MAYRKRGKQKRVCVLRCEARKIPVLFFPSCAVSPLGPFLHPRARSSARADVMFNFVQAESALNDGAAGAAREGPALPYPRHRPSARQLWP